MEIANGGPFLGRPFWSEISGTVHLSYQSLFATTFLCPRRPCQPGLTLAVQGALTLQLEW